MEDPTPAPLPKKRGRKPGGRNKTHKYNGIPASMRCSTCRLVLSSEEFSKVPSRCSGLNSECKPCAAKRLRLVGYKKMLAEHGRKRLMEQIAKYTLFIEEMQTLIREDVEAKNRLISKE